MLYRGAVLMIGSLYWDNLGEEKMPTRRRGWQQENLDMDKSFRVHAPIRYGRLSSSRDCSYTMVLSNSCNEERMGVAILVPYNNTFKTFEQVKEAGEKLWYAEGGLENSVSGSWGAVGLLKNPNGSFLEKISFHWQNQFIKETLVIDYPEGEKPNFVDGLLEIDWLRKQKDNLGVDFDFIFAAVTQNSLVNGTRFPTAEEIVQNYKSANYRTYFDCNRDSYICTFQDDEILRLMKNTDD